MKKALDFPQNEQFMYGSTIETGTRSVSSPTGKHDIFFDIWSSFVVGIVVFPGDTSSPLKHPGSRRLEEIERLHSQRTTIYLIVVHSPLFSRRGRGSSPFWHLNTSKTITHALTYFDKFLCVS